MHDSGASHSTTTSSIRSINAITSGVRRNHRSAKRIKISESTNVHSPSLAKCEIDTRADTCCCGVNCRPIAYTGQVCEVSGFHQQFESISSVPVGTFATAHTDQDTGETVILILHEALGFGDSLDHTLINPNQIRSNGIPVWDNPFDPQHNLGIDAPDMPIAFHSSGSTIYFIQVMQRWNIADTLCSQVTLNGIPNGFSSLEAMTTTLRGLLIIV